MIYKIEISDLVYSDIKELTDYVYNNSYSRVLSDKLADDLFKAIFSLNFMPEMYQKYIWEYRRLIVKWSFKIIYKIDKENKKVIIMRVIRAERRKFEL